MAPNNRGTQTTGGGTNGWEHHKRLVMYRLDGIESELQSIRTRLDQIERRQVEQATTLRITAAALGAAAGLVPTAAALLLGGM